MDSTVITMFSNSLIILTGAILNFIFDNSVAGWILLGLFGFTCILGIILYRKYKKTSNMIQEDKQLPLKSCKDCWHNYHCPMPQEGYNFNPDTCTYNSDNKR